MELLSSMKEDGGDENGKSPRSSPKAMTPVALHYN
jgi:hypothetical protein